MYLSPAIRQLAAEHMKWMQDFIAQLLHEEQLPTPLAPLLLAIYEGILTVARVQQSQDMIALAQQLLDPILTGITVHTDINENNHRHNKE